MASGTAGANGGGEGEKKLDNIMDLLRIMSTQLNSIDLSVKQLSTKVENLSHQVKDNAEKIKSNKLAVCANILATEENETAIKDLARESKDCQEKVILLENRLRRKNIILKGFPQEMQGDLKQEIINWLCACQINVQDTDLERVHWVFRGVRRPRDIVVAFVREAMRDQVYLKLRKLPNLKFGKNEVWAMQDLAPDTIKKRTEFKEITKTLSDAGQKFSWIFPSTLLVWKDGKKHVARDLEEGRRMLIQLQIINPDRQEEGAAGGVSTESANVESRPDSQASKGSGDGSLLDALLSDLEDDNIDWNTVLRDERQKLSGTKRAAQKKALERIKSETSQQKQRKRGSKNQAKGK